ncbi:MAG: 16S rRNA (cytosine(1402)-N(4))-methyltransferase RsmH [Planctomycetota bacterium]|nr:16S rRNA (cytosine(1402)-N(4))-methyltransferase RsmH [Planctomycetota bacterium]
MPSDQPNDPSGPPQGPHKRRPRYPGKYPRRFEHRYKELTPDAHPEIQAHVRAQGRTPAGTHVPVLVAEVMEALRVAQATETVIDCTVGYGGHALEFLKRIGPTSRLLGFDVDAETLERTRARLEAAAAGTALLLRRGNFAGIDRAMAAEHIDAADVIFADLGVSSMQVDDPARGFSYKFDGPLDMRMDARLPRTAADLLRDLPAEELAAALMELADEPKAVIISRRIAEERQRRPITQTQDLVRLIFAAKGLSPRHWRKQVAAGDLHPAAKTFQALRILVNDELGALRQLLRVAPACLAPGGRMGIISFHSGEDRLVKLVFRDGMRAGVFEAISDEPVRPTATEVHDNPRSASAKFRWAVKA